MEENIFIFPLRRQYFLCATEKTIPPQAKKEALRGASFALDLSQSKTRLQSESDGQGEYEARAWGVLGGVEHHIAS